MELLFARDAELGYIRALYYPPAHSPIGTVVLCYERRPPYAAKLSATELRIGYVLRVERNGTVLALDVYRRYRSGLRTHKYLGVEFTRGWQRPSTYYYNRRRGSHAVVNCRFEYANNARMARVNLVRAALMHAMASSAANAARRQLLRRVALEPNKLESLRTLDMCTADVDLPANAVRTSLFMQVDLR